MGEGMPPSMARAVPQRGSHAPCGTMCRKDAVRDYSSTTAFSITTSSSGTS